MTVEIKKMNIKKVEPTTPSIRETATSGAKESLLSEVKGEFKKITWTSPEELKTYTKVVVGATFAFGFGIYAIDLVLQVTLNTLEYLIKVIVG